MIHLFTEGKVKGPPKVEIQIVCQGYTLLEQKFGPICVILKPRNSQ